MPSQAPIRMRLDVVLMGRVTIAYLRFGAGVRIRTEETRDYYVAIPLAGRSRSRAGKRDEVVSTPGSATVFMPDAATELYWSSDAEQLCLMLDNGEMKRELAYLLGSEPQTPLMFEEKMDLRAPSGRSWMQALRLVDREAEGGMGLLEHRLTTRRLEQMLIDGMLLGHRSNYSEQLTAEPPAPGGRTVSRAIDVLQGRPEHPWTISELAAEVAVSARTLQSGFRTVTGTTPMAYLQGVRLERAHEDLLQADPRQTTVSFIAHRWGFFHLGRFAVAYRERYGEPPSKTLRRNS